MLPLLKIPFKVYLGIYLGGIFIFLLSGPFITIIEGYFAILLHPSLLVTDYLAVGGLTASFLNAWVLTGLAALILIKTTANFSGIAIAGLMTVFGFAFFGKNVINVLPIWIGFYLYTRIIKSSLRQYVGTFLFSSGIAPSVSYIMFGLSLPYYVGISLGVLVGVLIGILTPLIVAVVGKFHQGNNLYNTGFGLGFIALLLSSILKALQVPVSVETTLSTSFHIPISIFVLTLSIGMIGISIVFKKTILRPWSSLLQTAGNLPSDYVKLFGVRVTLFNIGTLGLFALLLSFFYQFELSGPVFAGVLTLMGFGAYGKHLLNVFPIIVGVSLVTLLPAFSLDQLGVILAFLFGTALAPISGRYGPFYGVLAGFLIVILAPVAFEFQGGFDLYNFGFAAGFVAGIVSVVAQQFPIRFPSRVRH